MTIGELARAVGVPTSTVRYYERTRLLKPDGRTSGNYRVYSPAALNRLRFIRAAQANGFTLDDVLALVKFRDGKTAPCREVQSLVEERLADLRNRMDQMREVEFVLKSSLRACRRSERTGRCQVIDDLRKASSSPLRNSLRRKGLKRPEE